MTNPENPITPEETEEVRKGIREGAIVIKDGKFYYDSHRINSIDAAKFYMICVVQGQRLTLVHDQAEYEQAKARKG